MHAQERKNDSDRGRMDRGYNVEGTITRANLRWP